VVDHTEASKKRDVNGHVVLGNSVHGRGDEGCLEGDALRDWGVEGDFGGREAYGMLGCCTNAYRTTEALVYDLQHSRTVRFTAEAAIPWVTYSSSKNDMRQMRGQRTDVPRKHEEVIVGKTTVLLGVDERLDVNAIALWILVLENVKSLGVVQSVGSRVGHGVAVGDGHCERRKGFSMEEERGTRGITRETGRCYLEKKDTGRGKLRAFPREKSEKVQSGAKEFQWARFAKDYVSGDPAF